MREWGELEQGSGELQKVPCTWAVSSCHAYYHHPQLVCAHAVDASGPHVPQASREPELLVVLQYNQ